MTAMLRATGTASFVGSRHAAPTGLEMNFADSRYKHVAPTGLGDGSKGPPKCVSSVMFVATPVSGPS